MVGHLLEYHPAVTRLKELIDGEELGALRYLYGNRLNLGKLRADENALWSLGAHDVSVVLHLTGEEPDECVAHGLAPVVTFSHFTAPHWFAQRGSWLSPEAPAAFARYCDTVMERIGDRIAYAVTLNEPNLPHVLSWLNLPDFVRQVERATLEACSRARVSKSVQRSPSCQWPCA